MSRIDSEDVSLHVHFQYDKEEDEEPKIYYVQGFCTPDNLKQIESLAGGQHFFQESGLYVVKCTFDFVDPIYDTAGEVFHRGEICWDLQLVEFIKG